MSVSVYFPICVFVPCRLYDYTACHRQQCSECLHFYGQIKWKMGCNTAEKKLFDRNLASMEQLYDTFGKKLSSCKAKYLNEVLFSVAVNNCDVYCFLIPFATRLHTPSHFCKTACFCPGHIVDTVESGHRALRGPR